MRILLTALLRAYRYFLSPMLGPNCRFYPSCSCYAEQALEQHGVMKGCYLAARRLSRCHPWHDGGYDPVPQRSPTRWNPSSHG
jgi:putative membrane protein insertion efficiency factor